MEELLNFVKENPTFFLATIDGDQARVRPFGFMMPYEGRICLCTNNKKPVWQQMMANPKVEICACSKNGRWVRVSASVSQVPEREAKEKALEIMPALKNMYSLDDGIFEIFALDEAEATYSSMTEAPRTVKF